MNKKLFTIRIILWSVFACALPILFIGWRYSLFKKVGSLHLSGWGLIGIVILFVFTRSLVRYIKNGLVGWSMFKQILNGVFKVLIPLGAILLISYTISVNVKYFIQAMSWVLICEAIAIPMNPFPQWVYIKQKEEKVKEMKEPLDYLTEKLFEKKKEEDS